MHLVSERAALPTGLPAPFEGLTQRCAVRAEVSGILDQDESALEAVLKWPALQRAWRAGQLVSRERVAAILREALEPSAVSWTQFTLLDAVRAELGEAIEVEPEAAERLGGAVNRKTLQAWEHHRQYADEFENIKQFLSTLRFRTVDGGCGTPSELIASHLGGDEARRAAFAPAERRLSPAYAGSATEFFLACRPEMRAPIIALTDWARAAEPGDSSVAVLRYLLEGELGRGLAQELRRDGRPSWLDDISDSCLAGFSEQEKLQIRAIQSNETSRCRLGRA